MQGYGFSGNMMEQLKEACTNPAALTLRDRIVGQIAEFTRLIEERKRVLELLDKNPEVEELTNLLRNI